LVTDLICKGFFDPYRDWCERAGKLFVGHVKGEEHPLFQIPMVGSCQRVYRHLSIPGIDALERYPSNHFFPRQAFSVASQFGDGRSLVECCGGAGWGASPEDLERYLLWLGRNGMTDFVLHLSQYRLDSAAIRDWPPSQPLHMNWREAYPEVLKRVRRNLLENPLQQPDTLVIAPYRGIMAEYEPEDLLHTNIHNACTYPSSAAGIINRRFMEQIQQLHESGVGYHLTDERTFEESASTADGRTILGNCSYGKVLTADGALLNSRGLAIIEDVKTAGGQAGTIIEAVAKPLLETPVVVLAERDSVALTWKIDQPPENAFLLECRADNGGFIGEFRCFMDDRAEPQGQLRILFADDASGVVVNGCEVAIQRSEEGSVGFVPWSLIVDRNMVYFHCPAGVERPFVWITGDLRVESQTPFKPLPGASVLRTKGPMVLCVKRDPIDSRGGMIEAGYPFLRAPLVAETSMVLTSGIVGLRFCGVSSDAAKVTLDGGDSASGGWVGWIWGPDWTVTHAIPAGAHQLKIELIPSTYNFFGPHHYYGGDWHVLSPGQYDGIKNFADPVDAPATTHVDAWHFKPLELPSHAQVFSEPEK